MGQFAAYGLENREAVHTRQAEIENDEVEELVFDSPQCFPAVACLIDRITRQFESPPQQLSNFWLIIDNQNTVRSVHQRVRLFD